MKIVSIPLGTQIVSAFAHLRNQEIDELVNSNRKKLKFSTKSFFKTTVQKLCGKVKSSQTQMIANKRMLMIPSTTSWSNE